MFIYKILIFLSTVVYADGLQLFGGKKSSENEGSKQSFNNDEIVDDFSTTEVSFFVWLQEVKIIAIKIVIIINLVFISLFL